MSGLSALRSWQTIALQSIQSPARRERLQALFGNYHLDEARAIIEDSNNIGPGRVGIQEKGAVGEAVVAATLHHFFATFECAGEFLLQYELWAGRSINDRFPVRQMDILFMMETPLSERGSVAFQVEVKNYKSVTKSTVSTGHLAKQIGKDYQMLNPRIEGHAPVVPVWWFLQGCEDSARSHLEVSSFRVVDFTRDPFLLEMLAAFKVPQRLRR